MHRRKTTSRSPGKVTAARPSSVRFDPGWAAVLLIAALAAAYSNSFQGEFIFDDISSIRDNSSIRRLWPLSEVLWPPPQEGRTVDGRPLVNLSLALNYAISGLHVWSYHALNLAVHMAAALLLFGVVRRTLLLPKVRRSFDSPATPLALAVALLWGLHPLQTESVTYVVQRAESMVGMFYLLTLYCVVRGEDSANFGRWHVAACLSNLAGMATKEVMVTAPAVVFVYLWVFGFDSWREVLKQRRGLLLGLASGWILLAALVIPLSGRGGTAGFATQLSPLQYAAMQLPVVVLYLKLCFYPSPLVLDYGAGLVQDPAQIVLCGSIILLLVLGTFWSLVRKPWIGFLGSAFFLILSPSSSIVPVLTQTLAEHRMYLPLAAVVCLCVLLVYLGLRRLPSGRLPLLVLAAVALLMGVQTWLRNLDYRTGFSIWSDTVQKQPLNARAQASLAREYLALGNADMALQHSELAVQVNPNIAGGYHTRGAVFAQMQKLDQALADFDRALELDPTSAKIHFSRGTVFVQRQEFERAVADFDQVIASSPAFAEAYQNRGVAHRRLGRLEDAVADFDRALQLDPDLQLAYRNRALALAGLGRETEASVDVQTFVQRGGVLDEELRKILTP